MRYPTATAFRRALEDRLNRRARTTGESTMRLRKNVVLPRLFLACSRSCRIAGYLRTGVDDAQTRWPRVS